MKPNEFIAHLAGVHLRNVFNPYADFCDVHDRAGAAHRRRKNLETFLKASLDARAETIWIARDLGYRGGRRTGIPMTDEVHLELMGRLLGGVKLRRATRGPIVGERTAGIVWNVLSRIKRPVVLWNVFPFHPHKADDPFTNRCHAAAEREQTIPLLRNLIEMVNPKRLVAIGRDAQRVLGNLDIPVTAVRHPSYGGQAEFMSGLYRLYGVGPTPNSKL